MKVVFLIVSIIISIVIAMAMTKLVPENLKFFCGWVTFFSTTTFYISIIILLCPSEKSLK